MFSHIMIGSNDIDRSKKFYDALFAAMGAQPGTVDARGRLAYAHTMAAALSRAKNEEHRPFREVLPPWRAAVTTAALQGASATLKPTTQRKHGRAMPCDQTTLKKDKGPDHNILAAPGVGRRGRVDAGGMERPARDGAVGHRVVAFEHRDLGRLLPGNQYHSWSGR